MELRDAFGKTDVPQNSEGLYFILFLFLCCWICYLRKRVDLSVSMSVYVCVRVFGVEWGGGRGRFTQGILLGCFVILRFTVWHLA